MANGSLRQKLNPHLPELDLLSVLMALTQRSVRIISRRQRESCSVRGEVVTLVKTKRQLEREMVQTVASWIDERRKAVKQLAGSNTAKAWFKAQL